MNESREMHRLLNENLAYYAKKILKIKDKSGRITPFTFNRAQLFLHEKLEEQRRRIGKVRALVLKGRQQGCSTYTAARFYHAAVRHRERNVFILSHHASTTGMLFGMVQRFQQESPDPVTPALSVDNIREYKFQEIGSEYKVGTAGSADIGRGGTLQLFHGSEVAYWQNTDSILSGVLQAVPDMPATEIILESTANGMANMFYTKCMEAMEHKSDFQLVFIPWFWQDEYRRATPPDGQTELSEDESAYQEAYGLSVEQMYWRRAKITELGSLAEFQKEYPAHVMEAFQTSGDSFIQAAAVLRARKADIQDKNAPLVMGVDPGRNRDRSIFAYRRGREFLPHDEFRYRDEEAVQMDLAGRIALKIQRLNPVKVFIDPGEGWGIIDRLRERGFGGVVEAVRFGSGALEPDLYINKRAEMWTKLRDYLHGEDGPVSIPDDDATQRDLVSMPRPLVTSTGRIKMVGKEEIRRTLGLSPDIGDAMALTFAAPVGRHFNKTGVSDKLVKTKPAQSSPLSTLERARGYNKRGQLSKRR